MPGFENTALWRTTLSEESESPHPEERDRLRIAYLGVRERAAVLAAEIPLDLRQYTVHDATHLDALWELADEIAGPDVQLNPSEAFVLGCAFLLHDLGMGLAAFPDGLEALTADPAWPNLLVSAFEDVHQRPPAEHDLDAPDETVLRVAKEYALREKHAEQAENLALISWRGASDTEYRLIEDADLRDTFGPLIGRIARSHWWPVERLPEEFRTVGGAVQLPGQWTIDALRLACLLRLADAAHLDARRAPGFLLALRRPTGVSLDHWTFQSHLQRVHRVDDRLHYTSTHRFSAAEASAWWTCLESLRMVDGELRQVDSLLADLQIPRFAARSVIGVDDPQRLATHIPTDNWLPIDARIKVTDVSGVVFKLGGSELYGDQPEIALRELLANASDAIGVRRLVEGDDSYQGCVTVRLDQRPDGWVLEVSDNGIGMSTDVLSGALLDFGRSFWSSPALRAEFPQLAGQVVRATGRYGIGFFSIFMLGDQVEVRTRRFDSTSADTHVLEVQQGLGDRPLLRRALETERLMNPGTMVRVRLTATPTDSEWLLNTDNQRHTLRSLVEWLAPTSPVDLRTVDPGDAAPNWAVRADDWKELDAADLFDRLYASTWSRRRTADFDARKEEFESGSAEIISGGEIVGRGALSWARDTGGSISGVVTVGGFRAGSVSVIAGVLVGEPLRAARDVARPIAPRDVMESWTEDQVNHLDVAGLTKESLLGLGSLLSFLGCDTDGFPVCLHKSGAFEPSEVCAWARNRNRVILNLFTALDVAEAAGTLRFFRRDPGVIEPREVTLSDDVLVSTQETIFVSGLSGSPDIGEEWPQEERRPWLGTGDSDADWFWRWYWRPPLGLVLVAVADAWECSIEDLLQTADLYTMSDDLPPDIAIGVDSTGVEYTELAFVTLKRKPPT